MTEGQDMQILEPPDQLTPPQPVEPVSESSADKMIKIDQAEIVKLDERVDEFVDIVVSNDVHTESFQDGVMAIHNIGTKEIRASANVSNRMLNRPVKSMEEGLFDDGSEISKSLVDLRRTVEDLDPSKQGDLLSPQKLLGMIPFGNKVRNYFLKYQSAQGHINAILNSLYRGQDELRKDNAVIEQEKANMWSLMVQLQKYAIMGKKLDEAIRKGER